MEKAPAEKHFGPPNQEYFLAGAQPVGSPKSKSSTQILGLATSILTKATFVPSNYRTTGLQMFTC